MPPFEWIDIPDTGLCIRYDSYAELYALKDETTIMGGDALLVSPEELPGLIAYLQTLPTPIIPTSEGQITCQQ